MNVIASKLPEAEALENWDWPVTERVPPIVALLVTAKPVPAELKVLAPVKVLAVVPDWV